MACILEASSTAEHLEEYIVGASVLVWEFLKQLNGFIKREAGEHGVTRLRGGGDAVLAEAAEEGSGGKAQEEEVERGGIRGEGLVGGDEMLDEMPVRGREAEGAYEDGPRGAGVADG